MFRHTYGLANLFNYGMLKERLGIILLLRGLPRTQPQEAMYVSQIKFYTKKIVYC